VYFVRVFPRLPVCFLRGSHIPVFLFTHGLSPSLPRLLVIPVVSPLRLSEGDERSREKWQQVYGESKVLLPDKNTNP